MPVIRHALGALATRAIRAARNNPPAAGSRAPPPCRDHRSVERRRRRGSRARPRSWQLHRRHQAALQLQRQNGGGTELREVCRVSGAEISLCPDVQANRLGNIGAKPFPSHRAPVASWRASTVQSAMSSGTVAIRWPMSCNSAAATTTFACALELRKMSRLQSVLGHGDGLAEIGCGAASRVEGEYLVDDAHLAVASASSAARLKTLSRVR